MWGRFPTCRRFPIGAYSVAVCLLAQTATTQSVFKVGARLVEVDVVVRANNATPTLTAKDFELLENGKPRKIAVFSVAHRAAISSKQTPLAPGVVSNRLNHSAIPPNATIILVDLLNTTRQNQYYVNIELANFLKTMKDTDQVALYALNKQLQVIEDFTGDVARLKAAAAKF